MIPAGDVKALAAAMDDMLADREATVRLGANGRARFLAAFTWEKVYPAWRRVFDLAMSRQTCESTA